MQQLQAQHGACTAHQHDVAGCETLLLPPKKLGVGRGPCAAQGQVPFKWGRHHQMGHGLAPGGTGRGHVLSSPAWLDDAP